MIYVVIGPSCAGKTSFVANTFIKGQEMKLERDITTYTSIPTMYMIGNWTATKRSRGTDMISRPEIKLIVPQIEKLLPLGKDILIEGDKICCRPVLDQLTKHKFKLIYIRCTKETSIARNRANNSTAKDRTLKAICTKSSNIYERYKDTMDCEIIDTDDITDFTNFSWDSVNRDMD